MNLQAYLKAQAFHSESKSFFRNDMASIVGTNEKIVPPKISKEKTIIPQYNQQEQFDQLKNIKLDNLDSSSNESANFRPLIPAVKP